MKAIDKTLVELTARSMETHQFPTAAMVVSARVVAGKPSYYAALIPPDKFEGFPYTVGESSLDEAIQRALDRDLAARRQEIEDLEARAKKLLEQRPCAMPERLPAAVAVPMVVGAALTGRPRKGRRRTTRATGKKARK